MEVSLFLCIFALVNLDAIIVTVVFACCATAHFVGMCLTGILARHRVQYLSLAWILAIFFVVIAIVAGVAAIGGGAAFTVIKKKK